MYILCVRVLDSSVTLSLSSTGTEPSRLGNQKYAGHILCIIMYIHVHVCCVALHVTADIQIFKHFLNLLMRVNFVI